MTGLSEKYIKMIKHNIKINIIMSFLVSFSAALLCIAIAIILFMTIFTAILDHSHSLSDYGFSILALSLSLLTLLITALFVYYNETLKLQDELKYDKIKKKEAEAKHIEDSISLFYVPLQNLLTVYNESGSAEVKLKMINEINGYKYLAEPRVRVLFEKYLQTKNEPDGISRKLLELVCRDLEFLQKQILTLNDQ